MNNINARLETLRTTQAALREAFYDFQDALLDRADGTEYHHDVKDLLEEAEKHMDRLERSTEWTAIYMNLFNIFPIPLDYTLTISHVKSYPYRYNLTHG
ncbi:hypothetical protein [Intestinirhabdus alba]|jgi:transcriptional/translational regulatory protein YebC/TACO1|uniref:Uncharacterized protein n=1 Tax=Intestinirhabdus alba TaxID=2899544 RepID=A0A6L6IQK5_9ENTR|nr:hypothetical protein [Intestinirhabdus alba]MTH47978.1 hypothetical protein [Intestinirhabdus alba]